MEAHEDHQPEHRPQPVLRALLQAFAVVLILGGGVALAWILKSQKKDPPRVEAARAIRKVDVMRVDPADETVTIVGHGTVRAKNTVQVIPQVSGRVVEVSEKFKAGYRVAKDDVLFRIESADFENALARAKADEQRLAELIKAQNKTVEHDRRRLESAKRSRALAAAEFDRVKGLYEQDKVGTLSVVEASERTLLARENEVIALESSIDLHPIRIAELNAQLASAAAQLERAQLDLDRTTLRAPFAARVDRASVQVGQVVMAGGTMGSPAGVLSDLSVFEVPVSIDNVDLAWLPTASVSERGEYVFRRDVDVTIRWAQGAARGEGTSRWRGRIGRLEAFDAANRTISLVVEAVSLVADSPDELRLEEGMFCEVAIEGRTAKQVYRVPRGLVSSDGIVQVVRDGRLALNRVEITRADGDDALIGNGLRPGELVITTPVENPVAGMPLEPAVAGERESGRPAPADASDEVGMAPAAGSGADAPAPLDSSMPMKGAGR